MEPKALASNYAETPSARLHNWNVLDQILARLGAGINSRLKSSKEQEEVLPEIRFRASGLKVKFRVSGFGFRVSGE